MSPTKRTWIVYLGGPEQESVDVTAEHCHVGVGSEGLRFINGETELVAAFHRWIYVARKPEQHCCHLHNSLAR